MRGRRRPAGWAGEIEPALAVKPPANLREDRGAVGCDGLSASFKKSVFMPVDVDLDHVEPWIADAGPQFIQSPELDGHLLKPRVGNLLRDRCGSNTRAPGKVFAQQKPRLARFRGETDFKKCDHILNLVQFQVPAKPGGVAWKWLDGDDAASNRFRRECQRHGHRSKVGAHIQCGAVGRRQRSSARIYSSLFAPRNRNQQ